MTQPERTRSVRHIVTAVLKRGACRKGVRVSVCTLADIPPHHAVIVSAKVAPRAVDRTRLKRQLRAALAAALRKRPLDRAIAVIAYARARSAKTADLAREIEQLLPPTT